MENKMTEKLIAQFKSRLIEDEKSDATIRKYIHDLEKFFRFTGGETVTKEMTVCYKQHLLERYAPSSVNSMLAAVNCFFKQMGWFDCVVKTLKIQRQAFRAKERELTKEEYFRLLEAARAKNDIRLYLLMQTICATGIRVSELQFITVRAVRRGFATVMLKGKVRTVLLPSALCEELKDYAEKMGIQDGSLFISHSGRPLDRSNIFRSMKALCETAGVDREKVFPHNLRHLFASLFYEAEHDLSRLADILGHSSVNTTRIYTSVSGEKHARQIEKLGLVIRQKEKQHNIRYVVS